jgi:two-component system response regulator PilR (NtrC family)
MQVKLLRVLQQKVVRKVGGTQEEPVDVRIIAATNRDLAEMIAAGTFREDLFYRIHVIPLRLPPLRERREDIPLLVDYFVRKYSEELGTPSKRLTRDALGCLEAYRWPGNVRELENLVERTLALATRDVIELADLPQHVRTSTRQGTRIAELPAEGMDLETYLDEVRAELMRQALERSAGVQTHAAEVLGMSFRSFRYYAKKAGIVGGAENGEEEVEAAVPG